MRRAMCCWLLLALGLHGTAWAMGGRAGAPPRPATSLDLIARAEERGEIDPDTAVLYRVYAVLDEEKLPVEYRGTAPIKDATPVLRHARSRYGELRPEIREALKPYLFPKEGRR